MRRFFQIAASLSAGAGMLLSIVTTGSVLAAAPAKVRLASTAPGCEAPTNRLPPSCEAKPPCDRCRPPDTTPRGGDEEEVPRGGEVTQELGAYIAPPRTGSTRGAVTRRGVDGGSITFPEIRLRMPSFELPCLFRSRSHARMMIDAAEAPWESHGYATGVSGPYGAGGVPADPRGAQPPAQPRGSDDDCEKQLEECRQELLRLQKEMDRLKQLEECVKQYQESQGAAGQSPTREDPIPKPPPDLGARKLQPVYSERPASFTTDSRVAREPTPISEPRRLYISEPAAPRAKITGVRSAR